MRPLSGWLAAVLLVVLVACDGSDTPGPDRTTAAPQATRPVEDPCPRRLPQARAGTHGLGTTTPATSSPTLPAPEVAWVCAYDPRDLEPRLDRDGGSYEWVRSRDAVAVTGHDLALLVRLTGRLEPIDPDQACRTDLGPRLLLVLAHGDRLTGVAVDDFGCANVRLTDDPHRAVPGETNGHGTVRGVLRGPHGLLAAMQRAGEAKPDLR